MATLVKTEEHVEVKIIIRPVLQTQFEMYDNTFKLKVSIHIKYNDYIKNPVKIFECSCVDGFTGDFCEFRTEQNQLFYLEDQDGYVFNTDGQLLKNGITFDDKVGARDSCFTMLNGEALILGGHWALERQVTSSTCFRLSAKFYFLRFLLFPGVL